MASQLAVAVSGWTWSIFMLILVIQLFVLAAALFKAIGAGGNLKKFTYGNLDKWFKKEEEEDVAAERETEKLDELETVDAKKLSEIIRYLRKIKRMLAAGAARKKQREKIAKMLEWVIQNINVTEQIERKCRSEIENVDHLLAAMDEYINKAESTIHKGQDRSFRRLFEGLDAQAQSDERAARNEIHQELEGLHKAVEVEEEAKRHCEEAESLVAQDRTGDAGAQVDLAIGLLEQARQKMNNLRQITQKVRAEERRLMKAAKTGEKRLTR